MPKLLILLLLTVCLRLSGTTTPAPNTEKAEEFYEDIKEAGEQNWAFRQIYPRIFRLENEAEPDSIRTTLFAEYSGAKIVEIHLEVNDVFIPEGKQAENKWFVWLAKAGNTVHPKTREWVLKEHLFFAEGDILNPKMLQRNLRYLHNLGYFSDIQVEVKPLRKGEVEMWLILKERFSFELSGRYVSTDNFRLKIDDRNFLGLGKRLQNTWQLDPKTQGSIGWESYYANPNIAGSFISGELFYTDLPGYKFRKVQLNRPFLYPLKSISGGVDMATSNVSLPKDSLRVKELILGSWLAKSWPVKDQYAFLALAVDTHNYDKRPIATLPEGIPWQDRVFILSSLGYTKTAYKRMAKIDYFFDNEYLPVGYLAEILAGYEFGDLQDRAYLSWQSSLARRYPNDSFLHWVTNVETFFRLAEPEESVFLTEPMYISPLHQFGGWQGRSFLKARCVLGFSRWPHEYLQLSTDPYFRGSIDLWGSQLLSLSMEEDLDTGYDVYGFGIGLFGFGDANLVVNDIRKAKGDRVLLTEGLGLRLRNPKLVWEAIELQFSMSQMQNSRPVYKVVLKTKAALKLLDFEGRRPSKLKFQ